MAVIEYANLILLSMLMAIFVIIDIPEAIVCYARIRELLEHENTDTFPEPYASSITNSMSQSTKHSTNQGSYQTSTAVSYTHLDVYKRQIYYFPSIFYVTFYAQGQCFNALQDLPCCKWCNARASITKQLSTNFYSEWNWQITIH